MNKVRKMNLNMKLLKKALIQLII